MLKVVSRDLWPMLRRKAAASESRRAAIAYVTDGSLLSLRSGDVLVTDASDAAIAGSRASVTVLSKYLKSGAKLFSLDNLHAKAMVFDDWAVIGSANASQNSISRLVEAAVLTDRPELVGQTEKLIYSLASVAIPIDKAFIKRISTIPIIRQPSTLPRSGRANEAPPLSEQRFWFLGISEDDPYPGDSNRVVSVADKLERTLSRKAGSLDWFWWPATATFAKKASVGDIVIDCWRPSSRSRSTTSVRVYKHARIAQIFQERGIGAKAFLCVWPQHSEAQAITWTAFLALVQRAGIRLSFTPQSEIELNAQQSSTLYEL